MWSRLRLGAARVNSKHRDHVRLSSDDDAPPEPPKTLPTRLPPPQPPPWALPLSVKGASGGTWRLRLVLRQLAVNAWALDTTVSYAGKVAAALGGRLLPLVGLEGLNSW